MHVCKPWDVFSDQDIKIIHAAMLAMVHDIHACQDNLTKEEWDKATLLCEEFRSYLEAEE